MNQNKPASPTPSKIDRKLKLSRQTVAPLAAGEAPQDACAYTQRVSGCRPTHTC